MIGLFSALLRPAVAQACAVCLTGVASGDPTAAAFNWSVLFLMAMPYAVVGSVSGWLFYTYRRASRKRGAAQAEGSVLHLARTHKEIGR